MRKERKHFTPEEKVAILRRHLVDKVPVSELCEELASWDKSLKSECIRPRTPLSLEDARRLVEGYVERYNNVRLNSATGYITPRDMLMGRQPEIHAERDRKLEAARQQRQSHRQHSKKRECASWAATPVSTLCHPQILEPAEP